METQFTIVEYTTDEGKSPFAKWLTELKDKQAKLAAISRLTRIQAGHLGDYKPVGDGISELRIHIGAGHRIYFFQDGQTIILLLCAGDKRTQPADIRKAKSYLEDYQRRKP